MWRDYSSGYLKNNRASGVAVVTAAFISALLLSLLCGWFYNLWKYEVERIELEEGGWQSRIVGEFDREDIVAVENFDSVKAVTVSRGKEKEGETALELYFYDYGAVLKDTPRIAELAGVSAEEIHYNYELLAMYLIRDSGDTAPRLLFPMFLLIMVLAAFSLIIIIHNSFAASMNARIHQFGILPSIGATPRQIRTCLLQEAAALCAVPVLLGNLLGIGISMGLIELSNVLLGSDVPGRHKAVFGYHPLVLGASLLATVITIWISAWMPAGKLSRLTPLEAIRNTEELQLKRKKRSPVLSFLFGVEGELAGNALKAQRKALRTASLSLIFSFMAFTIMQCFFITSEISTGETYFERYQDTWDIMVTVKDAETDTFRETEEVQNLPGVESAVVYQKAMAKRIVREEEVSEEMKAFGGFSHASANDVTRTDEGWLVNAPIVVLDDNSFLDYCVQLGIAPRLDGGVILNCIRDVTNPDFRHPQYGNYIKENPVSILRRWDNEEITAEVPILAYTMKEPVLREEYATIDYYELVHFFPVSLWREIKEQIGGAEKEVYIRVLGAENVTLTQLTALQEELQRLLGQAYAVESENRIQEYQANRKMIQGMRMIFGGFCVLLALIGIGNVFSNTMGFVRQRKREFARYMSVGLTPGGICKMFWIEGMVVAFRPILLALPVAVLAVGYMLKLSYLEVGEFLAQAPLTPVAVFVLAVLGAVTAAYGLAWRNMRKIRLAEVLRDDTMM